MKGNKVNRKARKAAIEREIITGKNRENLTIFWKNLNKIKIGISPMACSVKNERGDSVIGKTEVEKWWREYFARDI